MGKSSGKKSNQITPVFDLRGLLYNPLIHILLIAAVGFLAYSNTFHGPFQWDEQEFIVGNPIIEDLSSFLSPSKALGSAYYPLLTLRPVGYFSFALNYKFHGLNVAGYHIINLLIHIMNAALVYFLILFTFRTPYFRGQGSGVRSQDEVSRRQQTVNRKQPSAHDLLFNPYSHLIALAVALFFVAHPVQTEAVTYIFQRLASLVSMFYLLSLVLYVKGRLRSQNAESKAQNGKTITRDALVPMLYYILSLLFAVLAMKTKENAFTLPLVITLYEFLFFSGPVKTRLFRLAPFLLTMLIIPLTLIGIDKAAGEIISQTTDPATLGSQAISRNDYLFTQFRVIVTYLRLIFLPVDQNIAYDYPVYHSLFDPPVFLSFLFLTALFGMAGYLLYKSRAVSDQRSAITNNPLSAYSLILAPCYRLIAFGIFWFFITISVESSIIPLPMLIDEYRVYLPSVGAFTSIVTGAFVLMIRAGSANVGRNEKVVLSMLILAVVALTSATYARNTLWMDNVSLWQDVVRKSPNLYRGYTNLGKAYFEKGQYEKAIDMFDRVVALRPSNFEAYNNRGNALNKVGRINEAISDYDKAIALHPSDFIAYNNRGNIFNSLGRINEAISDYDKAIALHPSDFIAYNNRGNIFNSLGRINEAIADYEKVIALNPSDYKSYAVLGVLYGKAGSFDRAIECLNRAITINPNGDTTYNDRGFTYFLMKRYDKALADFNKAIELNQNNAQAYGNRGNLRLETGDKELAISDFQKACNLGAQGGCTALKQHAK
jgi:tetratricopeptide (TPR) repeat protein